jgi:hypothetical protein
VRLDALLKLAAEEDADEIFDDDAAALTHVGVGNGGAVVRLALSGDERLLAVVTADGAVAIHSIADLANGSTAPLHTLPASDGGSVVEVVWAPPPPTATAAAAASPISAAAWAASFALLRANGDVNVYFVSANAITQRWYSADATATALAWARGSNTNGVGGGGGGVLWMGRADGTVVAVALDGTIDGATGLLLLSRDAPVITLPRAPGAVGRCHFVHPIENTDTDTNGGGGGGGGGVDVDACLLGYCAGGAGDGEGGLDNDDDELVVSLHVVSNTSTATPHFSSCGDIVHDGESMVERPHRYSAQVVLGCGVVVITSTRSSEVALLWVVRVLL